MVKDKILSKVAKSTGMRKAEVRCVIEALFQTIQDTMAGGEDVHFRGFGVFANKKRAKRIARNISQNTALVVEERHIPTFSPSKQFSARVIESMRDLS